MTDVWIVVPTYDEAENLPLLTAGLLAAPLPEDAALRILVVDDDSPDGTGVVADTLAAAHPEVRVVHHGGRGGLAGAYRDGFATALAGGADVVVQMDADLSHDPADVPRLVAAVLGGADVAIGSRYVADGSAPGLSAARRALSRGGGAYSRLVLGSHVRDLTGGFKAWRAGALRRIDPSRATSRGYAFQIELTHLAERAGLTVAELPVSFGERRHGSSKLSTGIAVEALGLVLILRLRHGRMAAWFGTTHRTHLGHA